MRYDQLPINVFDLGMLVFLVVGILRGRKHGMSEEFFHVLKWIFVLLACSYAYERGGAAAAGFLRISLLSGYLLIYILCALAVLGLFALFKKMLGGGLVGSDFFGRSEYFLGMASGFIRFGCMLLAMLAVLNARYYSPAEVKAMEKFQDEVYGSNFFPTWHTAQAVVFEQSFSGKFIKDHFGFLLIKPTKAADFTANAREDAKFY